MRQWRLLAAGGGFFEDVKQVPQRAIMRSAAWCIGGLHRTIPLRAGKPLQGEGIIPSYQCDGIEQMKEVFHILKESIE